MENEFVDFYELLGVTRNVSVADLDHKYKEIMYFLSPESHPGKTYSDYELQELQTQREQVIEAYQTLKYKESRALYDAYYDHYKNAAAKKETRKRRVDRQKPVVVSNPVATRSAQRVEQPRRSAAPTPRSVPPTLQQTKNNSKKVEQPSRNNQKVERHTSERERNQKEGFFKSIGRQYREVRQDEKSDNLHMRHSRLNDAYDEAFLSKVTTIPREILYYTGKGVSHVSFEVLYQLAKLKYINQDAFTKYIIRNRKLLLAATLAGVMASNGLVGANPKGMETKQEVFPTYEPAIETPVPTEEESIPSYEPRVVLNRHYTIVAGDTLSKLSYDANSSISELKRINGYEDDRIYYGRKMWIPYTIDREDLEYYTENVKIENYSLEELAKRYETDIETLWELNKEAIVKTGDNTYYVLSDSLLVPHFATKQEVQERKQANSYQ